MTRTGLQNPLMRRIRLGIVANELFAPSVGRMGGFGWAVRQVCECFGGSPELGVDPVILMGERTRQPGESPRRLYGCDVVWVGRSLPGWARAVRARNIDLFLSIDFRTNYRAFFALCPRTPILVWVRDPWDTNDRQAIGALGVPGDDAPAQGVRPHATRTLSSVARVSRLTGRRLRLAVTTPALAAKVPDSYGVPAISLPVLPNIVRPQRGVSAKADRPVVAFLGRLDPYKRPWIMVEVARRMPDVEFVVMGQSHFTGPGTWSPDTSVQNVRYLGHVDDQGKRIELARAWLLLSTSLHEGLSVSFLEALAHETPLVSSVDTEALASRFGRSVGPWPGDGMGGVDAFEQALRTLIADTRERRRLGQAGRAWVEATHSREAFLRSFFPIVGDLGVRRT